MSIVAVTLTPVVYQGRDYPIHLRFKTPGQLLETDLFEMDFRESFTGEEVGSVSSANGDVKIDVVSSRATLMLRRSKTSSWFKKQLAGGRITESSRLRDISGTIVHTDKDGNTKGISGKVQVNLKFYVGLTRD